MNRPLLILYDRIFFALILAASVFATMLLAIPFSYAQGTPSTELPFNREIINRYSLDHLPRSLSIRQGPDVWFGYDLERAKLYKLWQSPANASGLKKIDFTVRSVGTTLYEDKSEALWQLRQRNELTPVRAYYRGCSHRTEYIELKWDLKWDGRTAILMERIPVAGKSLEANVVRNLRVEGLEVEEALLPPNPTHNAWKITKPDGTTTDSFQEPVWHRLTLP